MTAKITVRIEGVRTLLRDIREHDPVYAEPWEKALNAAVRLAEKAVKARAPGSLGHYVKTKVQARPVPLWGRVRLPNKSRRGFRYPGALQGGKRYHYRSGSYRGQETRGWFTKARKSVEGEIAKLLSKAEREIEQRWGKHG